MIMIGPVIIIIQNASSTASYTVDPIDVPGLGVTTHCEWCTWKGTYADESRAAKALGRHKGHCTANPITNLLGRKPNPRGKG